MLYPILTTLSLLIGFQISHAADLTPTEVYAKCHAKLSNHPVNIDSQDYKDVAEGKKDPIKTCMALFTRANFVVSGNVRKISNENDSIALGIVENFQSFHRSWFTSGNISGGGNERTFYSMVDFSTPALYITDALLGKRHYNTVFRRNDPITGVRRSETSTGYFLNNFNVDARQLITGPLAGNATRTEVTNVESIDLPRISRGKLVGVTTHGPKMVANNSGTYRATFTDSLLTSVVDDVFRDDIGKNFGGGIIGSPTYILMNAESTARLDGGTRVHRRMANNTVTDLLCLSMPNLKDNQVNAYLKKYEDSDLSFRQDKSCARCHATLDPYADTFRNIQATLTAGPGFVTAFREAGHAEFPSPLGVRYMKQYKVRVTDQVVTDTDNMYIRRQPLGQLFYNSISGNVVNLPVNGVQDLGNKISNQLDPYVCAAQKYYGFLTGVNISVNSGETTDFYKNHRAEIMKLGTDLKAHGSLQKLIEDIFNTEAFQTRFPGYELTQGGE